jgi:hypothetical protein
MLARTVATAVLILMLATPAGAGGKALTTPSLVPPATGKLTCLITNVSTNKDLNYNLQIVRSTGSAASTQTNRRLVPGAEHVFRSTDNNARYCLVEILSGNTKTTRVSVMIENASEEVLAALSAPSK